MNPKNVVKPDCVVNETKTNPKLFLSAKMFLNGATPATF